MPQVDVCYFLILVTVKDETWTKPDDSGSPPRFDWALTLCPLMDDLSTENFATYSSVLCMYKSQGRYTPILYWDSWKEAGFERTSSIIATMKIGSVFSSAYQKLADSLKDVKRVSDRMDSATRKSKIWTNQQVIAAALASIVSDGFLITKFETDFDLIVPYMDTISSSRLLLDLPQADLEPIPS